MPHSKTFYKPNHQWNASDKSIFRHPSSPNTLLENWRLYPTKTRVDPKKDRPGIHQAYLPIRALKIYPLRICMQIWQVTIPDCFSERKDFSWNASKENMRLFIWCFGICEKWHSERFLGLLNRQTGLPELETEKKKMPEKKQL